MTRGQSQSSPSQNSQNPHLDLPPLPPIDARIESDAIRRAYRTRCEAEFGEQSEEVAAEFLAGSHVARLRLPAHDAGAGGDAGVTVPAGAVVLVWPRGQTGIGDKRVVAWHPDMGLDRLLHLRAKDVERI